MDWSVRESVRAKPRLMVKRILRKYKYPPDHQDKGECLPATVKDVPPTHTEQ
jgi:hypothetical protein